MIQESPKPLMQLWQPTTEQEAKSRATDATREWLYSLTREEMLPYAGKWIAAGDCRVIASGNTFDELLANLGATDLETVIIHRFERPGGAIYR